MSSSLISLGLSGINAAQIGLATTGHNISNVNTAGYSRQDAVQVAAEPLFSGAGSLGNGVEVQTVRRSYSDQLAAQARAADSQSAYATEYADGLSRLNTLLGDVDRSPSGAMSGFFASAQALSTNPADAASRQSLLASAETLAQRFRDASASLDEEMVQTNRRIESSVTTINSYARQLATLNATIVNEQAAGRIPNDLLDRRDGVLSSLAGEARLQGVPQKDGSINVYLANGQSLVVGGQAQALATARDEFGGGKLRVGVKAGDTITPFPPSEDLGGALGGLIAYAEKALPEAQAGLGRLANALAHAVNAQHRQGQDRLGQAGGNFFSIEPPQVSPSISNTGNASLTVGVGNGALLQASDYRVQYDGAQWTVTRSADGMQNTFASMPAALDGLSFSAAGTARAGDAFVVSPGASALATLEVAIKDPQRVAAGLPSGSAAATGDNRGIVALAALSEQELVQGASFDGAYASLIAGLGADGREMELARSAGEQLAADLRQARESVAGVNLDEEAMKMVQYQQAYQAAGKMVAIANSLFDTILGIAR